MAYGHVPTLVPGRPDTFLSGLAESMSGLFEFGSKGSLRAERGVIGDCFGVPSLMNAFSETRSGHLFDQGVPVMTQ